MGKERGSLCGCSSQKKSQGSAVSGTFFIAFVLLFVYMTHASPTEPFSISVANNTSLLGEPVLIEVTGPNSTNFTLDIYTNDSIVLNRLASTDRLGKFQSAPNFSVAGRYTVNLSKDNFSSLASAWFDIVVANTSVEPEMALNMSPVLNASSVSDNTVLADKNKTHPLNTTYETTNSPSQDNSTKTEPIRITEIPVELQPNTGINATGPADRKEENTISIKDSKGVNIAYTLRSLNRTLDTSEKIEIIELLPEGGPVKKIEFFDLNTSEPLELGLDDVPEEGMHGIAELYAIDPTQLDFTKANVTVVAKGYELLKCKDWDFGNRLCLGEWIKLMNLTPGEPYTFELTPDDPAFSETDQISAMGYNNQRKIVRDSSGNLYATYSNTYSGFSHIFVATSPDDGYTWSDMGGGPIENEGNYEQQFPSIAIDSQDNLHVIWQGIDAGDPDYHIKYSNYTGSSWSTPVDILKITSYASTYSSIAVDSQDNLHVVSEGKDATYNTAQIKYLNRTASGWSAWENIQPVATYVQSKPTIVIDSYDNLHVLWYGTDATYTVNSQIKYSNNTGSGWAAWENIQPISSYAQSYVSAVVDSAGNIHISWMGTDAGSTSKTQLKYSNRTASGWSSWQNVYPDSSVSQTSPSVSIDSNGNVYLLWVSGTAIMMSIQNTSWSIYSVASAGTNRYPASRWSMHNNNGPSLGNEVIDFIWSEKSTSPYNLTYRYYIVNPLTPDYANYTSAQPVTDRAITSNISSDNAVYADGYIWVLERDAPSNETVVDARWDTGVSSVTSVDYAAVDIQWFYNYTSGTGASYYYGYIQVYNYTSGSYSTACRGNVPLDNGDNFRCNITSLIDPANTGNIRVRYLFEVKNAGATEDNNNLYIDLMHFTFTYSSGQSLETNSSSYNQAESVGISGSGWAANTEITLNLTYPNGTFVAGYPKNVTSTAAGEINDTWKIGKYDSTGTYSIKAFQWNDTAKNATKTFLVTDSYNPEYSSQNQKSKETYVSLIHTGDELNLSALWQDNIALHYAWLSTNETGSWANITYTQITGTSDSSNFSWSNASVTAGTTVSWRIYANDTSGLENATSIMSFEVWGWAEINESSLVPSSINASDTATMACLVRDANTTYAIANYPVSFHSNETGLLGINYTNSSGHASWSYTDTSLGNELLTCNITHNSSLHYNSSGPDEQQEILTTVDDVAPSVSYISPTPTDKKNQTSTTVIVNVSHVESNPSKIKLIWNGANQTQSYSGSYTAFTKSGLSEGTYTYYVWLNDTSGNTNQTQARTVTVDPNIPVITYRAPTPASNSYTEKNWIYINATVTDTYLKTVNLEWQGANETFDNIAGNLYYENKTGLTDGIYNFTIWAEDWAGNIKMAERRFVTIDLTDPVVSLGPPLDKTNTTLGSFYFNYTPTDTNINYCELWSNFSETWAFEQNDTTVSSGTSNRFDSFENIIPNTMNFWNVKCVDKSGRFSWNTANYTITRDTTTPTVSVDSITPTPVNASENDVTFNCTATDNMAIDTFIANITYPNGSLMYQSVNLQDFVVGKNNFTVVGTHNIKCWANDSAGNTKSANQNFAVQDKKAPLLNIEYPANRSGDNDGTIVFAYTVTDEASGIDHCDLYINETLVNSSSSVTEGVTQQFSWPTLYWKHYIHRWYISCVDDSASSNVNTSSTREVVVIYTGSFDGDTSDFSGVDVYAIENMTMENTLYGKTLNLETKDIHEGEDLYKDFVFEYNLVGIIPEEITEDEIKGSANVSFYNLGWTYNPIILDENGTICANCTFLSYSGGTLEFNTTRLTLFSTFSNSNLSVWDETNIEGAYAGKTKGPTEQVLFFANYTNSTSTEVISGATCEIYFTQYPADGNKPMVWNATKSLYEYNRSFQSNGYKDFNITCIKTGFEELMRTEGANIVVDVDYNTNGTTCANSTAGSAPDTGNAIGQKDGSYTTLGKLDDVYSTGYDTSGLVGHMIKVESALTYYSTTSNHRSDVYYSHMGAFPATFESTLPDGGSSASPLYHSYDHTGHMSGWTFADIQNFWYRVYNDDWAKTDYTYVDAICLNISYKNYMPNIFSENPSTNTTLLKENEWVRFNNINVTDDDAVGTVYFTISGVNETPANSGNSYYLDKQCTSSSTFNWTRVWANDTYNNGHWVSRSMSTEVKCDTNAPNAPSVAIDGFSEGSWLSGTTVTVNCTNAGDVGPAGINSTSYIFQTNASGAWQNISGCIYSEYSNLCYWTLPQDTPADVQVRCRVSDLAGHNSSWSGGATYEGIDNDAPLCSLLTPSTYDNITSTPMQLNATASDTGSGVKNVTFQYYDSINGWSFACYDDTAPYSCNWNVDTGQENTVDNRFRAKCVDNVAKTNYSSQALSVTIDVINTNPSCTITYPSAAGIYENGNILLQSEASETDPTDEVRNVTFSYSGDGGATWNPVGVNTTAGLSEYTYLWDSSALEGTTFLANCTAEDNRGGIGTDASNNNFTIDSSPPIIRLDSPSNNSYIYAGNTILLTVTDTYGSPDKSWYSTDGGSTNQSTTGSDDINTAGWTEGLKNIDYWANDSFNQLNHTSISFTVDNTNPSVTAESINVTVVETNTPMCLNVSVTDNYGISYVKAEIDRPSGPNTNVTLLDTGINCDKTASDNVYSATYTGTFDGVYNWTRTWTSDLAGNKNNTYPGVSWTSSSNSFVNLTMVTPASDTVINESLYNSAYSQNCSVSCWSGGWDCDNVYLSVEYFDEGTWIHMNTTTDHLYTDVVNYSCGDMVAGGAACSNGFTVTSDGISGGAIFPVRCHAEASNTPDEQTASVDITINDMPSAAFTAPAADLSWISDTYNLTCSATDTEGIDRTVFYNSTDGSIWDVIAGCSAVSGSSPKCEYDTTSSSCSEGDTCYFRCDTYDTNGANDTAQRTARIDNTGPATTLVTPASWANITASPLTLNASITDSGAGTVSQVFFEYRENASASWKTACTDTNGDTYYNCSWNLAGKPDSLYYEIRARANDTLGNLGEYDTHTNITIDRSYPMIPLNLPLNNTLTTSSSISFSFTPTDNLASMMNCSLYLGSLYNTSNATTLNNTLTSFPVSGIPEGYSNWSVKCADTAGNENTSSTRFFRTDYSAPSWSMQKQKIGTSETVVFHRGETYNLSAVWQDNYLLMEKLLSTNETGSWANTSWTGMTGSANTSSYLWQNNTVSPGTQVSWKIYGKDMANRTNSTDEKSFTVWGWSKVSSMLFTINPLAPSANTTVKCRVTDNVSSAAIGSHTVSFYNSTGLIGTNITGTDGWAQLKYSDDTVGDELIKCNITDAPALYYNDSSSNSKSSTLTITSGLDTVYCNQVAYNGGLTSGGCTELEISDDNRFNWTNISDSPTENTNYVRIRANTEAPEFVSNQLNFTWEMTRASVETASSKYRPGGSKGDITYTALSDMYYEGDNLYGTLTENNKVMTNLGLEFYVPEFDTETTYTKLGIKAVLRKFSPQGIYTEGLELHFYDFNTGLMVEPECMKFPASQESFATYTCYTTTSVENLIDTNGMVRIIFDDEELDTTNSYVWHIDYIDVRAYYDNPASGNDYSYRLGWYNHSSGSWVEGTLINANGSDTTHVLTLTGSNVTDAMSAEGNITGYMTFWESGTPTQSATRFHEFGIDQFKVDVNYSIANVDSMSVTNVNESDGTIGGTTVTLKNMYGEKVGSSTLTPSATTFTHNVAENYNYTVEIASSALNLILENLNITDNLQINLQSIDTYTGTLPQDDITGQVFAHNYIGNVTSIAALDDSALSFEYARLTIQKNSLNISKILHCTDWNFASKACNSWEINETSSYADFGENATHFWFNATSFDSFGGGSKVAIPNITNITIYNVTGLGDTHTGGILLDAWGLNTTIGFNVTGIETWRAEFTVRNDGDANWIIAAQDTVYHNGLNSSWQVDTLNDIWYDLGGPDQTGGTWSGGQVSWDTSNGGLLPKGSTMTFYYVFNITPAESADYSVYFLANDTSQNAGSYDYSTYNITALGGWLNSTFSAPPDNTVVPQNRNFTINATVYCWDSECGTVSGTARYNSSGQTPDTAIPVGSGTPFYIQDGPNPKSCGTMNAGDNCTLTWSVNSTAALNSRYEIDVDFTSTYPATNNTADSTVSIGKILLLSVGFSVIDFGTGGPDDYLEAIGNSVNLYNVTLDENSNDAAGGLWTRGTNLTNPGQPGYNVSVENIDWNASTHAAVETLKTSWSEVQASMSSGTNTTFYYWVTVPRSTMADTYNGTVYFMVNDTY